MKKVTALMASGVLDSSLYAGWPKAWAAWYLQSGYEITER